MGRFICGVLWHLNDLAMPAMSWPHRRSYFHYKLMRRAVGTHTHSHTHIHTYTHSHTHRDYLQCKVCAAFASESCTQGKWKILCRAIEKRSANFSRSSFFTRNLRNFPHICIRISGTPLSLGILLLLHTISCSHIFEIFFGQPNS